MSNNFKKKTYVNVGAMNEKREKDDQGRPVYYIKLDEKADVRINGVKVTALNIERPTDKFERMVKSGKMTEAEYDEKMAQYEKDGKLGFVKFEVKVTIEDK